MLQIQLKFHGLIDLKKNSYLANPENYLSNFVLIPEGFGILEAAQ